jgi:hypothetical protein
MHTDPTESRTQLLVLADQFRQKGYSCEEIREEETTIHIFRLEAVKATPSLPDLSLFPATHLHSN